MRATLIGLAAVLLLGAGVAGAEPPAPTAEQIAQASARADAILATAEAGDLFENATHGSAPAVRHKETGAWCWFGDDGGEIILPKDVPHGDQILCHEPWGSWDTVLYIRRAKPDSTAKSELAALLAEERAAHPSLRPTAPPPPLPAGLARPKAIRPQPANDPEGFLMTADGKALLHIVVRVQDGWVFAARIVINPRAYQFMKELNAVPDIDSMFRDPSKPGG